MFSGKLKALSLYYRPRAETHRKYSDLSLEQTNLLEVRAVVVVTIQLRQLSAIPDMLCEHPDACQVCVQLRSEDDDALLWHGL
jgi:hypothetical protein